MAPSNPIVNGVAFIRYIQLQDMANSGAYKANPTIAAGDFKVSIDGGALNNLATLPSVAPAGSTWVKIALSAAEMTGDNISVQCIDQTNPKEWADYGFPLETAAAGWLTSAAADLNGIADALLKRDWTAVTGAAARSLLNAGRKLMNRVAFVAPTLTVYEEDDATPAYTQTVAQDAAQTPFKSLDTN